jgi:UDP-4-amino-4,6-dideoxy-N-acetyl-beta-L-altrosamine N-acetyltransferase
MIQLLRVDSSDKQLLFNWRNQVSVNQWMFTNHLISETEHGAWFGNMIADASKVYWKIVVDGVAAGVVFFTGISKLGKECSFGMYLADEDVRGKGVAQAACVLSFHYAFTVLAVEVVKCEAIAQNEIAIALYESVGFVRTGLQVDAVMRGNEMLSVVTLELTRDSWTMSESNVLQKLSEKGVSING